MEMVDQLINSQEGFEEILEILKELRHITVQDTKNEVFEKVLYYINHSRLLENLIAILKMYSDQAIEIQIQLKIEVIWILTNLTFEKDVTLKLYNSGVPTILLNIFE